MPIQSWNIETGEQSGGVSPHAASHHLNGADAISAAAIGARPLGVDIDWGELGNIPEPAIRWPTFGEVSGNPFKIFTFTITTQSFFAIPINFQNDNYAAYCCKLMGGGHIGGRGYGGFEFNFWAFKSLASYSTSLINQAYIGFAASGIVTPVATSNGVTIQVVNQSTTAKQDMRVMLSVVGSGHASLFPIF